MIAYFYMWTTLSATPTGQLIHFTRELIEREPLLLKNMSVRNKNHFCNQALSSLMWYSNLYSFILLLLLAEFPIMQLGSGPWLHALLSSQSSFHQWARKPSLALLQHYPHFALALIWCMCFDTIRCVIKAKIAYSANTYGHGSANGMCKEQVIVSAKAKLNTIFAW